MIWLTIYVSDAIEWLKNNSILSIDAIRSDIASILDFFFKRILLFVINDGKNDWEWYLI